MGVPPNATDHSSRQVWATLSQWKTNKQNLLPECHMSYIVEGGNQGLPDFLLGGSLQYDWCYEYHYTLSSFYMHAYSFIIRCYKRWVGLGPNLVAWIKGVTGGGQGSENSQNNFVSSFNIYIRFLVTGSQAQSIGGKLVFSKPQELWVKCNCHFVHRCESEKSMN